MALKHSFVLSFFIVLLHGCLFVKAPDKQQTPVEHAKPSPLPLLAMSDLMVRSSTGDMVALLPEGWQLLNPDGLDGTLALAVNTNYTVAAVFRTIPPAETILTGVRANGLHALAESVFEIRNRHSGRQAVMAGTVHVDTVGTRVFGRVDYSVANRGVIRCAVFQSTEQQLYEFALAPLTFTARQMPTDLELDQAFRSILSTIQY